MYVCEHIPQHNNLSTASLLITLTVFGAGATKQPDIQTQTDNFSPARALDQTVFMTSYSMLQYSGPVLFL